MIYQNNKYKILAFIFILSLIALMVMAVTVGIAKINFFDSIKIILSNMPFIGDKVDVSDISKGSALIIWKLRVPRVIIAALTGAGLSICGGVFQGMFRNPMADPYILGISSGAAFGATVSIVFGSIMSQSVGMTTIAAFCGAILTTIVVYFIARTGGRLPTATLLLSGVAFSFLLSSAITLMMVFNRKMMEQIVYWSMGSFAAADWSKILIIFSVVIIGSCIIMCFARSLNIMSIGDETAYSLGVNVENSKKILLIVTSLMVAACVAVSGIIGFVGLIVPHITRIIFKPDHRILLPFSAIFGAAFMLLSDTLARGFMSWCLGVSTELPVGAITACFGAPFFIWLLIKNKRRVA